MAFGPTPLDCCSGFTPWMLNQGCRAPSPCPAVPILDVPFFTGRFALNYVRFFDFYLLPFLIFYTLFILLFDSFI